MNCPTCNKKAKVVATVSSKDVTIRKMKCINCNETFWTEEKINPIAANKYYDIRIAKYGRE